VDIAHEGFWIPEFRTLHDEFIPVPDPSDPRLVNVLLGRNGSGKSSLLEALRRLRDWSAADERWGRSAVAAFRVGAHFDGRETWHGEPRSQMDSLKWHLTSRDTLRESSIEDYVNGDPLLRHPDQLSSPEEEEVAKELEDPVPEQRKQFAELFGESLEDQLGEGGSDQRCRPFTFEKWLVAAAALRPAELEYLFHYDNLHLRIRIDLGDFEDPPAEEWIVRELHGDTRADWGSGDERFLIQARALQRSFFHQVDKWVSQVASALGDDLAGALVRNFLNRPLVLVGTAANERAAGFPAFFGLGLLTKDVDDEVASALDAGDPEKSSSALVTSLVKQWQSGSPIITIAHPSTRDAPVDLAQVRESPINWSTFHEVGLPRLPDDDTWFTPSEDPLDPPNFYGDPVNELVSRLWEADLRPSALMPSIIFATPQPEGLVGYLEEHLPVLHDQVFFSSPFMRTGWKPSKAKNEHPGGLGQQLAEAGYFYPIRPNHFNNATQSLADGWCVSGGSLGLLPVGEESAGPEGAVSLVVRGSVKSIARMITHRANQLAPGFLQLEGWIAVKVTSPADWAEGKPRISVRLVRSVDADSRKEHFTELGHLSDGLARWVALVVRLAVTDLQESRWEVPVNMNHEVLADSAIQVSNLPGFGTQVTAKEYAPSLGEVVSGLSIKYVNKSVDRYWFLFAAMEEPWRLIESTDEAHSWKNTVILIDEPEVHLHLDAQRSVRDWIGDISAGTYRAVDPLWTENATGSTRYVIVASHSTIFLDYAPETARTTLVYAETAVEPREPTLLEGFEEATDPQHDNIPVADGTQEIRTALTPVPEGKDIFEFFKGGQGERLGTSGIDVITLYRGFILVEGSHDEEILEHFYGPELRQRRIGLLRAWGTDQVKGKGDRSFALYEADLLTYIGKPTAILVDRARLGPSERAAVGAFVRSCERRKLPHWPDRGQDGGHPYPDIIAALPDEAVRAAFPRSAFDGWDPIVDEFEQMRRQGITTGNFKDFATLKVGLDVPGQAFYPKFIKKVLEECDDGTRPREGLELVMDEIISWMADPTANIAVKDPDN
jgi:hypothetical protein